MLNWTTAIGFDFGTRKIGIAIAQAITKSASPLEQKIQVKDGIPDWKAINKLIQDWEPDALVVGIPLNIDETEQPVTQMTKKFLQQIKQKYSIPTFAADERFTTKSAKERVFSQHGYKGLKKYSIDGVAAALILEQWITEQTKY